MQVLEDLNNGRYQRTMVTDSKNEAASHPDLKPGSGRVKHMDHILKWVLTKTQEVATHMDTVPQFVRLISPQSSHSNSVQLQKSQPVCQVIVVIICGHSVYTVERRRGSQWEHALPSDGTGRIDTDCLRIGHICSLSGWTCHSRFSTGWI